MKIWYFELKWYGYRVLIKVCLNLVKANLAYKVKNLISNLFSYIKFLNLAVSDWKVSILVLLTTLASLTILALITSSLSLSTLSVVIFSLVDIDLLAMKPIMILSLKINMTAIWLKL